MDETTQQALLDALQSFGVTGIATGTCEVVLTVAIQDEVGAEHHQELARAPSLPVEVSIGPGGIRVGVRHSDGGVAADSLVEFHEGKLVLRGWSEGNQDDPNLKGVLLHDAVLAVAHPAYGTEFYERYQAVQLSPATDRPIRGRDWPDFAGPGEAIQSVFTGEKQWRTAVMERCWAGGHYGRLMQFDEAVRALRDGSEIRITLGQRKFEIRKVKRARPKPSPASEAT